MVTDRKIKRVAVVGCGIAGLAMVASIKAIATGVEEVVIFDPHDDDAVFEHLGGSIMLSGGALVLEKLGYLHALKHYGKAIHTISYLTSNDESILDVDLRSIFPKGSDGHSPLTFTMRWSALRQLLYDCAFKDDGQAAGDGTKTRIIYRPKRKFSSLAEDPETGKVTLFFSNRMHEGDFDLVIGADGVKSSVRKFTALPNETILTALPLGGLLPGAFGVQDTGLRVTQCISPPIYEKGEFKAAAGKENMTDDELLAAARSMSAGKVQHHVGLGCNATTMRVGDFDNTCYVLQVLYREQYHLTDQHDAGSSWESDHSALNAMTNRLNMGGFSHQRELNAMIATAGRPGGLAYDVGIKDIVWPLRSWSTHSGRVVLIGDSCHAALPTLNQGANQAIQDAFCLASLIYKHNNDQELALRRELSLPTPRTIAFWPIAFTFRAVSAVSRFFLRCADVRSSRPDKLQRMVYEYEDIRKHHTAWLAVSARMIAYLDTMGGRWGLLVKRSFFTLLRWSGLAQALLAAPALPVV